MTRNNGHYVVQGHSRSPILVLIESPCDFLLVINSTYLLSCTISKLWLIICQIFASDSGRFNLTPSLGVIPSKYCHELYTAKTRFFGLHFNRIMYRCIFNHFYVIGPKSYRIRRNNANYTAITPFKVTQSHRLWYQLKAHMRLPISD